MDLHIDTTKMFYSTYFQKEFFILNCELYPIANLQVITVYSNTPYCSN